MASSAVAQRRPGNAALAGTARTESQSKLAALFWDVPIAVGLALLPWLYFWRLFAPNRADQMTIAESDFTWGQFPLLLTAARALHDGAAPIWNPLSGGGQPLLAHPQTSALYPISWIAFAGMDGVNPASFLALEGQLPIHVALAGVSTFALGRVLFGSRTGAVIAALGFAYSGFLMSYPLQQLPILRSAAWFPLQTLAFWLALERRSAAWSVVTGITLGLAFLGGHPQTVFQEVVGLGVVGAAWIYTRAPTGWTLRKLARALTLLLLAGGVAVGMTALQWLPTLELMGLSSRTEEGYNFLAGGFSLWEVPLDLLAPNVLGGFPPYVGTLALVLVAAGILLRPSRLHAVFIPLALVGILLSLGSATFLFPALYVLVPGFDLFRNHERSIFLFSLAMAVLAGAGARAILSQLDLHGRAKLLRYRRTLGMLLLVALAFGAALYVGHVGAEVSGQGFRRWRDVVHAFFFFAFVLACSWGLLTARLYLPSARPALPALLVGLTAFDLFSVTADRQFALRPVDSVYHHPAVVERVMTTIDSARAADRDILGGNHGLMYGIPAVTSTFPLRLARLDTARQRLPEGRLFDILNVTHLIAQRGDPLLSGPGAAESLPDAGYVLFRRYDTPGPAYIVPEALRADSPEDALNLVAAPGFSVKSQVVVEVPRGAEHPRGGAGTIQGLTRGWSDVTIRASTPSGGYLVLADSAYPGWRAWVDGWEQPIWTANYLTQAVRLAPGEHTISFHYEPIAIRLGALISLATLVAIGLGAVWGFGWSMGRRTTSERARSG